MPSSKGHWYHTQSHPWHLTFSDLLEEARFPQEKRPQLRRVTPCLPQGSISSERCPEKPGPHCRAGLSSPRLGQSMPGFTPAHTFNPGGADIALFCSRVLGHCSESLVLTAGKSSPRSSWALHIRNMGQVRAPDLDLPQVISCSPGFVLKTHLSSTACTHRV